MVQAPGVSNMDSDSTIDTSYNRSRTNGDCSPEAKGELNVVMKKAPKLETNMDIREKNLLNDLKNQRPKKPDYYDADDEEVPYSDPDQEAFLTRAGIKDRQMRPPTSKLLIPVMEYNPELPRKVLWDAAMRREQAVREVIIHPVMDLEHYKLRDCITCIQREKQLKAEKEADRFAPGLQEFMVDDLIDGLTRLVAKVRAFHQEHMCVGAFLNLYLSKHFGNVYYTTYDLKTTREELRKFGKLQNCYAETMKCLELFCTRDKLDGFWKNAGLSGVYEVSQNEMSLALKGKKAAAKTTGAVPMPSAVPMPGTAAGQT